MLSFYINIGHCNISPTCSSYHNTLEFSSILHNTMDTAEYWPMAQEYGIWNVTIASLQFWTEDLHPVSLGVASEDVYSHFFWTPTSHTLHQLSNKTLFGRFVLALNAAFTQQLSLADEGYESGSNKDLPMPLCKTPHIYHISSLEHASFDPINSTPWRPVTPASDLTHSSTRPVHCHLSFSSDSDQMDTSHDSSDTTPDSSDVEDEDFQTVPLDDEHWSMEMVPERTFCIHKNGLPNNVCSYPCPYGHNGTAWYIDSLDLSDISDLEDHFLTTSDDKELPGLEEVPYQVLNSCWTLVLLEHFIILKMHIVPQTFADSDNN